jgi:ABC-type polysaccharide/polyol phosphate export permease
MVTQVANASIARATVRDDRARAGWPSLLAFLAISEFRSRYRAQALGIAWSLVSPLVTMGVLTIVLGPTLGTMRAHYAMFLLVGLVSWNFVSTATNAAVGSLVAKHDIVKRARIHRELIPVSVAASYLVNLGLEATVLVALCAVVPGLTWSVALLAIPPLVLALAILVVGVALVGATLNTLYRDVAYITSTALVLLFWLTPIVYPLEAIAEPYRTILAWSPLAAFVEAARGAAMDGVVPTARQWLVVSGSAIAAFAIGLAAFRRLEPAMLDHV